MHGHISWQQHNFLVPMIMWKCHISNIVCRSMKNVKSLAIPKFWHFFYWNETFSLFYISIPYVYSVVFCIFNLYMFKSMLTDSASIFFLHELHVQYIYCSIVQHPYYTEWNICHTVTHTDILAVYMYIVFNTARSLIYWMEYLPYWYNSSIHVYIIQYCSISNKLNGISAVSSYKKDILV